MNGYFACKIEHVWTEKGPGRLCRLIQIRNRGDEASRVEGIARRC